MDFQRFRLFLTSAQTSQGSIDSHLESKLLLVELTFCRIVEIVNRIAYLSDNSCTSYMKCALVCPKNASIECVHIPRIY